MAATGYTPILIYASGTATNVPLAANLTSGASGAELALNYTDGKLYYKDNSGVVQLLASKAGASGTVSSVDVSGGTTGLTTTGGPVTTSGTITLAGTLSAANGGTGANSLTANSVLLGNGTNPLQLVAPGAAGNVLTSNGTTWTSSTPAAGGTVTSVDVSGGTTGLTTSGGPVTTSGTITLAGTLIASNGGTGLSSYTAGDLLYYATGTALSKLSIGASNYVLSSSGSAPQWSNTLSVSTLTLSSNLTLNGGTANGILYLNGSKVATTGAALAFDGTNWSTTGTATAAAFIPSGSSVPTNGIYLPAANTLGFVTASGEDGRFDANGNFLIGGTAARGTTAGTKHLDLFDGTAPAGTLTNGVSLYSSSGDLNFMNSAGNGFKVGYRNVPPVGTKTGSYSLAAADVGKYVQLGSGGSITIPASTFAEGDVISLANNTTGNITITCSAVTTYIAGTDSVKTSLTFATRGVATVFFLSSSVCIVTGNVT